MMNKNTAPIFGKSLAAELHVGSCWFINNRLTPSRCQPDPPGTVSHTVSAQSPHAPVWCWSGRCCGCENCARSCLHRRRKRRISWGRKRKGKEVSCSVTTVDSNEIWSSFVFKEQQKCFFFQKVACAPVKTSFSLPNKNIWKRDWN